MEELTEMETQHQTKLSLPHKLSAEWGGNANNVTLSQGFTLWSPLFQGHRHVYPVTKQPN
jgi:hypothetical protein